MRRLTTLAVFGLLAGCGPAGPHGYYLGFETQVASFVHEASARGVPVDTNLVRIYSVAHFNDLSLGPYTVGVCYGTDPSTDPPQSRVEILESYWASANDAARELLIFHELGHCILHQAHTTCPNVMCPTVDVPSDWVTNRSKYLDFFFLGR